MAKPAANVRASHVRLEFYPVDGTIYIVGGEHDGESFGAMGGPSETWADKGGHVAGPTRAGTYILGPREHHTTPRWPMSVIPYGAELQKNHSGEVVFKDVAGRWHVATGRHGEVTRAYIDFLRRSGTTREQLKASYAQILRNVRNTFVDQKGDLSETVYTRNDFGRWAWDLKTLDGARTDEYIHSSRLEENEVKELVESGNPSGPLDLEESHGCIHVDPRTRDWLMLLDVLQEGSKIVVHPYDEHGPPQSGPMVPPRR